MSAFDEVVTKMKDLTPAQRQEVLKVYRDGDTASKFVHGSQARLSQFSGVSGKGDVSYEQWAFEVKGMQKDDFYDEAVIMQSIRRSL